MFTNLDENTIIDALEGDADAFESIYNEYSGFVYNVALRVVNSADEAQEVTQEVFLTVYRKLKSFKFKSSLKTWIYRITVNMAIDYARKRSKERDHSELYTENNKRQKTIDTVSEEIEREQQEKTISTLLETLNPDQRACIVLRSIEGLSYQEIADALNININTVRTRIKRARGKLIDLRKEMVINEV
ncbi:RNA polymerase sigma factor [Candidatus Scalindua japonica]|uniref:RNA polymerase sigma factor n=1 Tax=Candidatus Scalindua japonica TaxID=1284222 RepID=UPI0013A53A5D|nr:sigma-70 family RNA polymerase sigma factor [Candidatus Scalindua japonica]